MKSTFIVLLALMLFSCKEVFVNDNPILIPTPQQIVTGEGSFIIKSDVEIFTFDNFTGQQLANALSENDNTNAKLSTSKDADIIIIKGDLEEEEYSINIESSKVIIEASTKVGALHAVNTVIQLLPQNEKSGLWAIPCMKIKDAPQYSWRGLMLDPCRHFIKKESVLKYIDLLSYHKMNILHFHLNDDEGWRIEIKKYPKLTSESAKRHIGDGDYYHYYYTQEDIKEIVQYAAERNITVVPEIDIPGHAGATMPIFPELHCEGYLKAVPNVWLVGEENHGRTFCAGNPQTLEFLENVFTEVLELFPSKYIHIGGDEAKKNFWEECPKCRKVMRENDFDDVLELQPWLLNQIGDFISSKGRKIVGWDEILEGGMVENSIVHSWRGTRGGIAAAKAGVPVIMSYGPSYFNRKPETSNAKSVYEYDPSKGVKGDLKKYILGSDACLWSEFIQDEEELELQSFPKLPAFSEVLWKGDSRAPWTDFEPILRSHCSRLEGMGVSIGAWKPMEYKKILPANLKVDMIRCYSLKGGNRYSLQNFKASAAFDDNDKTVCMRVGPQKGECFTVTLDSTQTIKEISIVTGSRQNHYKWLHAVLEVSEDGENYSELVSLKDGQAENISVNKLVKSFRVRTTKSQDIHNWVVIRDLLVVL